MHERAKHNSPKENTNVIKETTKAKVKEEVAKKTTEGFENKPTGFVEEETREKFKKCPYKSPPRPQSIASTPPPIWRCS